MRLLAPWLLALWSTAFGQPSETVLEPKSKIAFPSEIEAPVVDGSRPQVLLGTGLRTKSFLRVKVYAVGLYMDENAIESLVTAAYEVGDGIVSGRFNKSLRLVTARSIAGESIRDAFEDALSPRFHRAREVLGLGGGEHDFEEFQSYFVADQMTKGTELVFSCSASGRLSSRLNEKQLGTSLLKRCAGRSSMSTSVEVRSLRVQRGDSFLAFIFSENGNETLGLKEDRARCCRTVRSDGAASPSEP